MAERSLRDDFRPTASWEMLEARAAMLRRIRQFFERRGFLEVETPILSADTVVDRHLDPVPVEIGGRRYWLQTSPEFGMKRLLAAGTDRRPKAIFQITRVFRREELGPLHNIEFTMVEWYRIGDGLNEGMQLLSDLGEEMLGRGPAERISYRAAFERHAGIDPHGIDAARLPDRCRELGITVPESLAPDDRDGWLDLILAERVQSNLGREQPAIVYDYPATQAALARVRPGSPPVAERFELYADGIELANGYHELLDPAVLRRRNHENNALRRADGKAMLPEGSRLLAAMEAGLPAMAGAALGFDRLVMAATGAERLEQVLAFPFERA